MNEETETADTLRRDLCRQINADPSSRQALEQVHGQVWTTAELTSDYEIVGFAAPLVVARRRSDGVTGTLFFQHAPRFYFHFEAAR